MCFPVIRGFELPVSLYGKRQGVFGFFPTTTYWAPKGSHSRKRSAGANALRNFGKNAVKTTSTFESPAAQNKSAICFDGIKTASLSKGQSATIFRVKGLIGLCSQTTIFPDGARLFFRSQTILLWSLWGMWWNTPDEKKMSFERFFQDGVVVF